MGFAEATIFFSKVVRLRMQRQQSACIRGRGVDKPFDNLAISFLGVAFSLIACLAVPYRQADVAYSQDLAQTL